MALDAPTIADDDLNALLAAAEATRQQCLALLDLLDDNPTTSEQSLSQDIQAEISKQQKVMQVHMSDIRKKQKIIAQRVRDTKVATADARNEVDGLHLRLQNLYYERAHLRGEIGAAEDYPHSYTQLPLTPVDEFLAERPDLSEADEHTVTIARIEHEHEERQKLEDQRQGLLKRKQELIAENKKRKDDLEQLDRDLEKFIDAAEPISTRFGKEY